MYEFLFILLAVPPYVPTISSIDDTSNFDEFESESSGPRIEDFMKGKEGFNGKNLPFIGFSFTRQLNASLFSDGYVIRSLFFIFCSNLCTLIILKLYLYIITIFIVDLFAFFINKHLSFLFMLDIINCSNFSLLVAF